MKKLILSIGLLLILGANVRGDGRLDQIHLMRQNDEVVVKIDISGSYQYRHEIAEAKDGKPFRVVVDLFPVIHNLPKSDFNQLPPTVISSLRTSQYAAKPTATARVVIDLNQSVPYRIERKKQTVWIYIPDQSTDAFSAWSSGINAARGTTPHTQKPVESKEPALTAPVTSTPPPSTETAKVPSGSIPNYIRPQNSSEPDRTRPATSDQKDRPQQKSTSEQPGIPDIVEASNQEDRAPEFTYTRPESSSVLDKEFDKEIDNNDKKAAPGNDQKKPEKKDIPRKDEPFDNKPKGVLTQKTDVDQPEYKKVNKSEIAAAEVEKETPKPTKAESESAQVEEKKADNTKETSRFRRKPAFPAKLKGTIVAEFPTRMVIKYQPRDARDPFESLISTEASDAESPSLQKILDVETSRLVGILESVDGKNRALLEDIDGYGYIVAPGDKVKKGYVSKIYSDKALFQLFEYGWSRTVALRLNEGK
jgi:hypothetical protein